MSIQNMPAKNPLRRNTIDPATIVPMDKYALPAFPSPPPTDPLHRVDPARMDDYSSDFNVLFIGAGNIMFGPSEYAPEGVWTILTFSLPHRLPRGTLEPLLQARAVRPTPRLAPVPPLMSGDITANLARASKSSASSTPTPNAHRKPSTRNARRSSLPHTRIPTYARISKSSSGSTRPTRSRGL